MLEYVNCISKTNSYRLLKLRDNAVPTLFHDLPKYLSTKSNLERTDPAKRQKLTAERHEKLVHEFLSSDLINDFDDFVKSYAKYIQSSQWKCEVRENEFIAYIINFTELPKVTSCIKINSDMRVTVIKNDFYVTAVDLSWLFSNNLKLTRWSQFENLLSRYAVNSQNVKNFTLYSLKETMISHFQKIIQFIEEEDDHNHQEVGEVLRFLQEQFTLAFQPKNARRYSVKMVVNSFMIYIMSPAAYDALRMNCLLVLPHVNYLSELTRASCISVENKSHNEHFLKTKCSSLQDREKHVALQLDEIYVKKKIDYKNGKLYGYAENSDASERTPEAAKTVLGFLISSVFGNFKEVAALIPVSN